MAKLTIEQVSKGVALLVDEMTDRKGRTGKVGGGRGLVRFVADAADVLGVTPDDIHAGFVQAVRSKSLVGDVVRGFQTPAYAATIAGERENAKRIAQAKAREFAAKVKGTKVSKRADILSAIGGK